MLFSWCDSRPGLWYIHQTQRLYGYHLPHMEPRSLAAGVSHQLT
jgi:hypothetical protein